MFDAFYDFFGETVMDDKATPSEPVLSIGIQGGMVTLHIRYQNCGVCTVWLPADEARTYAKMMVTVADSIDGEEDEEEDGEDEIQNQRS